jgi:malate dehydrogenase
MAMDERVGELSIYDLSVSAVPAAGVAADLSHIERKCKVKSYSLDVGAKPVDHLAECLTGCHLVLVPAGVPRKPGMDRADLLNVNVGIAQGIVEACAKYCPGAILGLIVNPVNSVVPAMAELYKSKGLDPLKVCGVTSLDGVRANKFVHEITGTPLENINVPVVGGHAGATILPLFSQDSAAATIPASKIPPLDKRVQDAGTEVVTAKAGKGSATLSMAYAGAKFGKAVLAGLDGERRTTCAYVMNSQTDLPFFTLNVTFGPAGVETVHPIGAMSEYERGRLAEASKQLKEEIDAGMGAIRSKL